MGNMSVCTAFSKLPVSQLVFNGAVRDGMRTWVQAWGPLPDEVSSNVARFHQQGLVKACLQSIRPREAKDHLQMQERETCHWSFQLSRQMALIFTVNAFWDLCDGPLGWTSCMSSQLHTLSADWVAYSVGWCKSSFPIKMISSALWLRRCFE